MSAIWCGVFPPTFCLAPVLVFLFLMFHKVLSVWVVTVVFVVLDTAADGALSVAPRMLHWTVMLVVCDTAADGALSGAAPLHLSGCIL